MTLARYIIAGCWFVCAGVTAQPTEIDLSRYLETPEPGIQPVVETAPAIVDDQAPTVDAAPLVALPDAATIGAPSVVEPATNYSPFFGMPAEKDPYSEMERQRLLLEQFGEVATLLREIKELGNDAAVLAMLEAMSADKDATALFKALFEEIEPVPVVQTAVVPVPVPAPALVAASQPAEPVRPKVVHPILPVFAQVRGASGSAEKVVVSIDGARYIRLPGETIEHEGRQILVESLEPYHADGRDVISIWMVENGRRFQLTW
ncbi:MAG: hypothetical protein Q8K97_17760 [Pseudohongiella sp.]|nr:hypothetical protein [Pseudohongiella sp.]